MVPGSTFKYGSNFCRVTRSPRLSSKQPMEAAAMPLPRDDTTPPVTNMYLVAGINSAPTSIMMVQTAWRHARDPEAYRRRKTHSRFPRRGCDGHSPTPATAPDVRPARGDPQEDQCRQAETRAGKHKDRCA